MDKEEQKQHLKDIMAADKKDGLYDNFYVDIPKEDEEEWTNVGTFPTQQEALDFAREQFGADEYGRVSLLSPAILDIKKEEVEEQPVLIGHLNKRWGMNGYQTAEIGHEVFLYKDRYQLTLQPVQKGLLPITVPFYKETLHQAINFLKDDTR